MTFWNSHIRSSIFFVEITVFKKLLFLQKIYFLRIPKCHVRSILVKKQRNGGYLDSLHFYETVLNMRIFMIYLIGQITGCAKPNFNSAKQDESEPFLIKSPNQIPNLRTTSLQTELLAIKNLVAIYRQLSGHGDLRGVIRLFLCVLLLKIGLGVGQGSVRCCGSLLLFRQIGNTFSQNCSRFLQAKYQR